MDTSFLVTSIVITATPGSGALFTIAAGLSRGVRAGIIAAVGCTLGIVPHLALALSGAAAVMAANPVLFDVIRWAGVAYLLYMAWGMWRDDRGLAASSETKDGSAASGMSFGRVIRDAVLVNLLNPKLTIFFFVFLPMFVDVDASDSVLRMAGLGAAFMGITFVIFTAYGAGAARVRDFVRVRPTVNRLLGRGFALTFVVLAVLLAITSQ
ncbi:LysE family translocator [Microbacterium sp. Au-Mic1]|uniref:LysE family translocator n=1 Tax=Microbacterium sp. Au-Mic1 TaxID=2906457 RepID=UPI001E3A167B|nr:LysE family translocator [Microbacterium sp. Au-Mic1]MCE4025084.1 LysE family translocator [Microbacterium sp. Au-Mic1]